MGRDIVNSPINIGIPPEKLPDIIEAATKDWRALTDQQKQTIDALQQASRGQRERAEGVLCAPLARTRCRSAQLGEKLIEIAGHYKEALAQSAPGPNDGPEIAKVKSAAKDALEAGQLGRADELLAQARKAAGRRSRIACNWSEPARSAQRGQLAMSQLRYREAAQHFADAASVRRKSAVTFGWAISIMRRMRSIAKATSAATTRLSSAAIERYRILAHSASARSGAARLGDDAGEPRQRARERSASGRAGRRVWRRRWRPIAQRWRNARAIGCRSTGRRRR